MSTLTKQYYREQYNYQKRELEKMYKILNLNPTQCEALRVITDRMIDERSKEILAPEEQS